jgi:hypothetical protein
LKRQNVISHSSAKAEYQVVANCVVEVCWLRQLLQEHHAPLIKCTLIYYDNVSTVYLSTNPIQQKITIVLITLYKAVKEENKEQQA